MPIKDTFHDLVYKRNLFDVFLHFYQIFVENTTKLNFDKQLSAFQMKKVVRLDFSKKYVQKAVVCRTSSRSPCKMCFSCFYELLRYASQTDGIDKAFFTRTLSEFKRNSKKKIYLQYYKVKSLVV